MTKVDLKAWETELLASSKQYDRLTKAPEVSKNKKLKPSIVPKPLPKTIVETPLIDLENGEILQHQNRVIDDQDTLLDQLSFVIARQKQIGVAIGNELELQVELLDETDMRVNRTQERMRYAARSMGRMMESSEYKGIF